MGDMNRHLGQETENNFLYAMQNIPPTIRPPWLLDVREASAREDSRGFDAFAFLDIGRVSLQIKSSMSGAMKYLHQYPEQEIIIAVVTPGSNEIDIREAMLPALERWREEKLSAMRRWRSQWMPILTYPWR